MSTQPYKPNQQEEFEGKGIQKGENAMMAGMFQADNNNDHYGELKTTRVEGKRVGFVEGKQVPLVGERIQPFTEKNILDQMTTAFEPMLSELRNHQTEAQRNAIFNDEAVPEDLEAALHKILAQLAEKIFRVLHDQPEAIEVAKDSDRVEHIASKDLGTDSKLNFVVDEAAGDDLKRALQDNPTEFDVRADQGATHGFTLHHKVPGLEFSIAFLYGESAA